MSLKTIAFINMKGGVGKTTLAVNIAYALAQFHGKKVLLVDMDPQFNSTQYLAGEEKCLELMEDRGNTKQDQKTILDIFISKSKRRNISIVDGGKNKTEKIAPVTLEDVRIEIYKGNNGKLHLIPSTLRLHELQEADRGIERKLLHFLERIQNCYDFILIDCPPTISVFTYSAFLASEGYVIPIKPDPLSTIGLPLIERLMDKYEDISGESIKQIGIIFTMVRNTRVANAQMERISKNRQNIFQHFLSHSTIVAECVEKGEAIFNYKHDRTSKYGEELKSITEEFLKMV